MSIAIIDYGVGNLRSVEKAFTSQGIEAVVTSDEKILRSADKLVLPGVGAFKACMDGLKARGFDELVLEAAGAGKPIIGLCVGLQMMFDEGHEFGIHKGLGLMPGRVVKFPDKLRVPHIGWNQVEFKRQHKVFTELPSQTFFYFVHSFYVEPSDRTCVRGETDCGMRYASSCGQNNIVDVQFHPEKSQTPGLRLLKKFSVL